MKDSVSAAEVGTGQYITTKGMSQTNLITTVTPEKRPRRSGTRRRTDGKRPRKPRRLLPSGTRERYISPLPPRAPADSKELLNGAENVKQECVHKT